MIVLVGHLLFGLSVYRPKPTSSLNQGGRRTGNEVFPWPEKELSHDCDCREAPCRQAAGRQGPAAVHRRQVRRWILQQDLPGHQPGHRRDALPGGRGRQDRRRSRRQGRPARPWSRGRGRRWTRPIAAGCSSSWPTWPSSTPRNWPPSSRSTAARRSPTPAATCKASSTPCATTPAGPTRSKAVPSRCAATSCRTRCGSRWAWSGRSSRGTSRC